MRRFGHLRRAALALLVSKRFPYVVLLCVFRPDGVQVVEDLSTKALASG